MEVRLATLDDADAVVEVFTASIETLSFLPPIHTRAEHRAYATGLVSSSEVWVAVDEGAIVGMASILGDLLQQLFVHPDAQGRGAGGALLDKTKELRPDGFTLWTFQQNERACRFYERRGLSAVMLTDGAGNEEKLPDVMYEWRPDEEESE